MNWINGADMLQDSNGRRVLKGFSDPEKRDASFVERIDMLLDGNEPQKEMIQQISKSMIKTMVLNTDLIKDKWNSDRITEDMQDELNEHLSLQSDKSTLLMLVYEKMLNHSDWRKEYKRIYGGANDILRAIAPLMVENPADPDDVFASIINQTIRRYLNDCASAVMRHISTGKKTQIPVALILPTLRRLAMLDVLDGRVEECKDWKGVLKDLEKTGDVEDKIHRTTADDVIHERTRIIRKGRLSLYYYQKKPSKKPPDGYAYIAKCCVYDCSNFETPISRHSVRCQTCWYFHCCSSACESYAKRVGLHHCDAISSKTADAIKKQTLKELKSFCKFCGALQDDLSAEPIKCDGCDSARYCCKECKEWDYIEGKHKDDCVGKKS